LIWLGILSGNEKSTEDIVSMTTEFNRHMDEFNELKLASPEILEASRKIVTFDKYNSDGGSESESRDYFEIQRLLETFDDTAEVIPPKTPLRSDYELLSDSICYYLRSKNQYKVEIKKLKGFLLPETISEGDITHIGTVTCQDGGRLITTNQSESFVYFSGLKGEILSKMGDRPLEKFKEVIGGVVPEEEGIGSESEGPSALADQLVARYRRGGLGQRRNNDSTITNLRELRTFLLERMAQGTEMPTSYDEVEEVIGFLASI